MRVAFRRDDVLSASCSNEWARRADDHMIAGAVIAGDLSVEVTILGFQ